MSDNHIVVLGYGPQEMDFFSKASKFCGKQAVIEQDVARMAGASFAIGTQEALDDLRARLEPGAVAEQQKASAGSLSENAIMWLATGRRGLSSETLFTFLTGHDCTGDWGHNHPHDTGDFGRCRKLLEQCPELVSCLPRVCAAGPEWAALVPRWNELCALMDEESPEWRDGKGRAPKTYALLNEIIAAAQRKN